MTGEGFSLNVKILLLVLLMLLLVMALITVNIHVGTRLMTNVMEREVNRMISESLSESLEDLLFRRDVASRADLLLSLQERMRHSRLLQDWILVEPQPRPTEKVDGVQHYTTLYMPKRILLWDRDLDLQDLIFSDPSEFEIPIVSEDVGKDSIVIDLIEDAVQSRSPRVLGMAAAIPLVGRRPGAGENEGDILWVLFGQTLPVSQTFVGLWPEFFKTLFWVMTLGSLLLLVVIYILLNRFVQRPLLSLVSEFNRVEAGDYSHTMQPSGRSAEFDRMALAFDTMRETLNGSREKLEREVQEATDRARSVMRDLMLAQRMNALGVLAAGVAHEINNPLGGMINAVRTLLRSEQMDEKESEYLELIQDGLRRVEEIVQRILVFGHQQREGGGQDKPFTMLAAVTAAQQLIDFRLQRQQVTFKIDIQPERLELSGSQNEWVQVFLNLFTNSLDAMAEGGILSILAKKTEDAVVIEVSDSGEGMSEMQLQSVFDLFFTTKPPGRGTGLGMAIVYNIVKNYGGHIDVVSREGHGTVIEISLPDSFSVSR